MSEPTSGIDRALPHPCDVVAGTDQEYPRWTIDRGASDYLFEFHDHRGVSMVVSAREALLRQGRISLLDVGCGSGRALQELSQVLRALAPEHADHVLAVGVNLDDYSQESICPEVCTAYARGEAKYVVGNILTVELSDRFDVITSFEMLPHLPAREAAGAVERMARLLAPGGRLYCKTLPWRLDDAFTEAVFDCLEPTMQCHTYPRDHARGFIYIENAPRNPGSPADLDPALSPSPRSAVD